MAFQEASLETFAHELRKKFPGTDSSVSLANVVRANDKHNHGYKIKILPR